MFDRGKWPEERTFHKENLCACLTEALGHDHSPANGWTAAPKDHSMGFAGLCHAMAQLGVPPAEALSRQLPGQGSRMTWPEEVCKAKALD